MGRSPRCRCRPKRWAAISTSTSPALGNSIGGIAVGDVSGKGIPAALQMAVVRTIFRIEARRRIFPAETLTRVNQSLQTEMQTQGMVTLLYAFVDPARRGHALRERGPQLPGPDQRQGAKS